MLIFSSNDSVQNTGYISLDTQYWGYYYMKYSYEYKRMCVEMYRKGKWVETPEGIQKESFHKMIRGWSRIEGASVLDAAMQTGFSDQSHFTGCFSRLIGLTPGAYRAMFWTKPKDGAM